MKNPVMWVASNYTLQINRRKVTASDLRQLRATFHETWEEAQAAQVAKAQAEFDLTQRRLKVATSMAMSAGRALNKAECMTKPEAA